jgi:hypothetical protein
MAVYLALVRKMLDFAVDHDWIEANPEARITKPTREISRERVLTTTRSAGSGLDAGWGPQL